jgi:hypothetical protein
VCARLDGSCEERRFGGKGSACRRRSGGAKMGGMTDRGKARGRTRERPGNDVPVFSRKPILFCSRDKYNTPARSRAGRPSSLDLHALMAIIRRLLLNYSSPLGCHTCPRRCHGPQQGHTDSRSTPRPKIFTPFDFYRSHLTIHFIQNICENTKIIMIYLKYI